MQSFECLIIGKRYSCTDPNRAHPDISSITVCYNRGNLNVFRHLGLEKMVRYSRKFVIIEYVLSDVI
jgi:hypothetical protein